MMPGQKPPDERGEERLPDVRSLKALRMSAVRGSIYVVVGLALSVCLPACQWTGAIPQGASLRRPAPAAKALERTAWVDQVAVSDPTVDSRADLETALQGSILQYLDEGGWFREVAPCCGKVGDDHLVLRFRFERYRYRISENHLNQSLFNLGTWYEERPDLSATLTVENGLGERVAEASHSLCEPRAMNFWKDSAEVVLDHSLDDRTRLVHGLVQSVILILEVRERSEY